LIVSIGNQIAAQCLDSRLSCDVTSSSTLRKIYLRI